MCWALPTTLVYSVEKSAGNSKKRAKCKPPVRSKSISLWMNRIFAIRSSHRTCSLTHTCITPTAFENHTCSAWPVTWDEKWLAFIWNHFILIHSSINCQPNKCHPPIEQQKRQKLRKNSLLVFLRPNQLRLSGNRQQNACIFWVRVDQPKFVEQL